jgi:hypothetical protein
MTPKEKAAILVEKCFQASRITMQGASGIFRQNAKNIAMITVDEIIDSYTGPYSMLYADPPQKLYWKEVKEEINKL